MVPEAGTALGERAERKGGAGGEQREVLPLDLENFGIVSFALSCGSEIPGPEARPEMQGGDEDHEGKTLLMSRAVGHQLVPRCTLPRGQRWEHLDVTQRSWSRRPWIFHRVS